MKFVGRDTTYPGGTTRFERDAEGRVQRMFVSLLGSDEKELVSAVNYLPFGPVAGITWNNPDAVHARGVEGTPTSLQQTRSYDQNYWIDRIESSLASGLQADITTDVVGNITAIAGAGGVPVSGYGYDDLYRLTSETAPGLSLAHAYDATGNRTAETVAGATTVYAYPPDSHRLTNIGRTARTFDEAGNLRVLNSFNRSSPEYTYDDRNRMAAYRVGGRDVATYAHNARGERVRKQLPKAGTETLFVYGEGGQLLGEYEGDGSVVQEYAWLDALPVAVLKKGGPYPIEPDHLGTPRRAIAAELDRAVWAWDLQGPAFGTHAANDDPDADGQAFALNLRFPGQYLDAESGLHYNYFRDYDPATGRYVESDPVGLEGGVASYSYSLGNSLRNFDATGLLVSIGCGWAQRQAVSDAESEIRRKAASCIDCGLLDDLVDRLDHTVVECSSSSHPADRIPPSAGGRCATGLVGGYGVTLWSRVEDAGCGCLPAVLLHELLHNTGFSSADHAQVQDVTLKCFQCGPMVNYGPVVKRLGY